MQNILIPVDFSPCANHAIEFATESAKIFPLNITMLHSFENTGNMYSDYMGVNKEFNQAKFKEANNSVAEIKKDIKNQQGIAVETIMSTEPLKESIIDTAAKKSIDCVIMGTCGASGLQQKLWGSKTASLIGKINLPILAVPIDYQWKKPQTILLATNHFEKDTATLHFILQVVAQYDATLHVIVFTEEGEDLASTIIEQSRQINSYENFLKDIYDAKAIMATHLYGDNFEATMQDYITNNHIDLMIMVNYRKSFSDKLFHPSMTKRMAYHTTIPLLIIPAQENA